MNFLSYPSYPAPLQQYNIASLLSAQTQYPFSCNSLKIPPFPKAFNSQITGIKRPNTYMLNEESKAIPVKKIKMDSFNRLCKASFSESDPYSPSQHSKENRPSSISCVKLNEQMIGQKITINLSAKTGVVKPLSEPKWDQNEPKCQDFGLKELISSSYSQGFAHADNITNVCVRNSKAPLFNFICQKLEQNCQALLSQMHGLIALSQDLKKETLKILPVPQSLDITQPGTPNTITSENLHEVKACLEVLERIQEKEDESEEWKETRVQESKKEMDLFEVPSTHMKKSLKKKKDDFQAILSKESLKRNVEPVRRMNRLQMIKSERSNLSISSCEDDNNDLSQKIVLTRVGEDYQAEILAFDLESENKTRSELKLKNIPEGQGIETCEREDQL